MKIYLRIFCSLAFVCFSLSLSSQREVSGIVKESGTGEALIGANVLISNTSTGTITDIDGSFELTVPDDAVSIEFSFTGFETVVHVLDERNYFEIEMTAGEQLDEVVVIGYGTVRREDATGSIQSVSTESFNKGAITGPQELLAGKVAGVSITTGGDPGAGSTIRIRGESSLSASNNPLIVIDGVPLDNGGVAGARNPLNIINPNDIESFTVLKDASAAAIYGNRASGGVILITTKKGKLGEALRLTYSGNISFGKKSGAVDILDADGFRNLINEEFDATHPARGLLGSANTNWQEAIYQTAVGHDHNIAATGSVGEFPYRVSLGYTDKQGILMNDQFSRYSSSINLSPKFLENRLQVNANLKATLSQNNFASQGAIGSAIGFDPTQPIFDSESPYGGYFTWTNVDGSPNTLAPANPIALLEQIQNDAENKRFVGNIQTDYRFAFLPELRANLNLAYDRSKSDGTVFIPENAAFAFSNGGEDREYSETKKNELLEFYLNYVKEWSTMKLDVMAGYSWQHFFAENYVKATNVAGTEILEPENFDPREYYLLSLFGRVNYTLMDDYLFTFTLRRDGTSRFSPENRYGLFPAAAIAVKAFEEPDNPFISKVKLRGGWGVTGQQEIGDFYAYLPNYQSSLENARYQFGNQFISTLRPNGYDANIRWEETTTYNFGVDLGFLKNRLNATVDLYERDTKDLLNFIPVPAGTNLTNFITTNVGDMTNKGIEIALNATVFDRPDFLWDIGMNMAYNENEITRLTASDDPSYQGVLTGGISGGVGSTIQIHSVGFAPSSFYVFEQVYDETGRPVEGLYVDRNYDGIINSDDQYRLEKPAADYTLGLTSRMEVQNFDLSFAGRANFGNYIYNNVLSNNAFKENLYNSTNILRNVHSRTDEINFSDPEYFSDFFIQEASFFRMDHITLGYNSNQLLGDFMRLYVTVQNPFVITDYEGLDPEQFGGIDNNIYPRPRTIVFGVSVDF